MNTYCGATPQYVPYPNVQTLLMISLFLDHKLLSQEIKETHEAFLMAKKYYKKYLKMYYTIESRNGGMQTIFLQFFTEAKKESENYSVRLLRDTKTGFYQCKLSYVN